MSNQPTMTFYNSIKEVLKERDEHIENYKTWGKMPLSSVMADANCMDQINALQNNLEYWYDPHSKRISQ